MHRFLIIYLLIIKASQEVLLRSQLPRLGHLVGIDNPLVLKMDTQETENLDKAIFS
jgi:hypothetical protein